MLPLRNTHHTTAIMPSYNLRRANLVITILAGLLVIAISTITCAFHSTSLTTSIIARDATSQFDDADLYENSTSLPHLNAKPVWPPWSKSPYEIYYGKGCKLWMMLQEGTAPAAKYNAVDDLAEWGWKNSMDWSDATVKRVVGSIEAPLADQGVTLGGGINVNVQSDHSEPYGEENGGKPTKGKYYEVYNPAQGAIIAYRNYGPGYVVENNAAWGDAALPDLKNWSDVVFLTWLSLTVGNEAQRKGLKIVVRVNVMNEDTRDVIEEALRKEGVASGNAPVWPGHVFEPGKSPSRLFPQSTNPLVTSRQD